jgi:hypothetical protein
MVTIPPRFLWAKSCPSSHAILASTRPENNPQGFVCTDAPGMILSVPNVAQSLATTLSTRASETLSQRHDLAVSWHDAMAPCVGAGRRCIAADMDCQRLAVVESRAVDSGSSTGPCVTRALFRA